MLLPSSLSNALSSVSTVFGESGVLVLFLVVIVWSSESHSFTSSVSTFIIAEFSVLSDGRSLLGFDSTSSFVDSGATF